jgi:branched-chain amino acid transport system permease protein
MNRGEKLRPHLPWIIIMGAVIFLPMVFPSNYFISVMFFVAIYGVLASSLGMLIGYAGLFSLAQPTWFGVGAYVAGVLAARDIVPPWMGIMIGALSVGLISYIIGAPVLRLRGHYLACATFGILIIGEIAFIQLSDITGGHSGLLGIPPLSIGGFVFQNILHYYFLSWALCIGCLCFYLNIIHSRVGRAIRASHDSEMASKTMGIDVAKYRLEVFILTSVVTGLAGGIFCFYLRFAAPSIFGFALLVELILMIIVGGIGNLWGYLLGSFVITWMGELLNLSAGKVLPVMTGNVQAVFFGILIILILIFVPGGLSAWFEQLFQFGKRTYEHIRRHPA